MRRPHRIETTRERSLVDDMLASRIIASSSASRIARTLVEAPFGASIVGRGPNGEFACGLLIASSRDRKHDINPPSFGSARAIQEWRLNEGGGHR